jgi:hypothetical protein
VPNPFDDADEDAQQPGSRRAVSDARANLVEPVIMGLDFARRPGQRPPQRLLHVVVLG